MMKRFKFKVYNPVAITNINRLINQQVRKVSNDEHFLLLLLLFHGAYALDMVFC